MSDPFPPDVISALSEGATLWQGRFSSGPSDALMQFTQSLSFDRRLAPDDIRASRAHVAGLARASIITEQERQAIDAALVQTEKEIAEGRFVFGPSDEDIHTAVERR